VAAEGWRAVSLDLRGHGESDWALNSDYSFSAFGADVRQVAKQLGKPPVLVGASLGGIAATLAEGSSNEVVASGLVLVDITSKTNPEGVQRIGSFMRSGLDGFDSLDEAADAIAAYTPQRKRSTNLDGLLKVLRRRGDRWFWHWDPAFITNPRDLADDNTPGEFRGVPVRNISVPTMLVRGLLSDVVTQEGVDHLMSLMPGATLVEVEGATHMIAGDKNDAFSDAVLSFLAERIRPTIDESRASTVDATER
jgi:pimeloyl-ACP methyl ester carboxylesterase